MGKAFEEIKRKLTENPVLYAPDYNAEFILQTDTSEKGLGVVLAQQKNNEEHPILFLCRKFTGAEKITVPPKGICSYNLKDKKFETFI